LEGIEKRLKPPIELLLVGSCFATALGMLRNGANPTADLCMRATRARHVVGERREATLQRV
jgi:hypothetical protein